MSKNLPAELESAASQEEIISRKLVTVFLDEMVLRFVAGESDDLIIDGNVYTAAMISYSDIETSMDGSAEKTELNFSNINREWGAYIAYYGNKINNRRLLIQEVLLDENLLPIADSFVEVFDGVMNAPALTAENFKVDVIRILGYFDAFSPFMTHDVTCQYKKYKDSRCDPHNVISSQLTPCKKTWETCRNKERYGGKNSIAKQMVIK